jgi:hypothetical protein
LFAITRTAVRHRPEWLFGFLRNHCSPSPEYAVEFQDKAEFSIYPESGDIDYGGWWATAYSLRMGRNHISVELRKLYEGTPLYIIRHYNKFAVSKSLALHDQSQNSSNIAKRASQLVDSFLQLGIELEKLSESLGLFQESKDLISFSAEEVKYQGWWEISEFKQLSNVAPENMNRSMFLERCVIVFKLFELIKNSGFRQLLRKIGVGKKEIQDFKGVKLLGTLVQLTNIAKEEGFSLTDDCALLTGKWDKKALIDEMSPLYSLNGLRNIQSHVNSEISDEEIDKRLKAFDVESNEMKAGWGKCLDIVYECITNSLLSISNMLSKMR